MNLLLLFPIVLHCIISNDSEQCTKLRSAALKHQNNGNKVSKIGYGVNSVLQQPPNDRNYKISNFFYFFPITNINPLNQRPMSDHLNIANPETTTYQNSEGAVFRDFEGSQINTKRGNKQRNYQRFKTGNNNNNRRNFQNTNFDPTTHKNWHLIPQTCGSSTVEDRITGGTDAGLGQYPWMARIGFVNSIKIEDIPVFRCGASIITKNHVITAAHCITDLPPELSVGVLRFGEYNTETDVDCIKEVCADKIIDIKPQTIIVHENYGTPKARNDIALIKLQSSITFTHWISPICLPYGNLSIKNYTTESAEVAGWGFYDISVNRGSYILQTVQLPILKIAPCTKAFRGIDLKDSFQLCVGGDLGKDSCNGDSGGPLMKVESSNGSPKYFLLGVVSLGAKYCGLTTAPAIYTRVTNYVQWILDNLN